MLHGGDQAIDPAGLVRTQRLDRDRGVLADEFVRSHRSAVLRLPQLDRYVEQLRDALDALDGLNQQRVRRESSATELQQPAGLRVRCHGRLLENSLPFAQRLRFAPLVL